MFFISGKRIRFGEGTYQKQFGREWCSPTGVWNLQISSLRDGGGCGMQKSKLETNVIVWRDETMSSVTQAPNLKHLRNDAFWLTQKYLEQASFCLSCRSWLLDDAFICEVLNWRESQLVLVLRWQGKVLGERAGLEICIANILKPDFISILLLVQIINQLRHMSTLLGKQEEKTQYFYCWYRKQKKVTIKVLGKQAS